MTKLSRKKYSIVQRPTTQKSSTQRAHTKLPTPETILELPKAFILWDQKTWLMCYRSYWRIVSFSIRKQFLQLQPTWIIYFQYYNILSVVYTYYSSHIYIYRNMYQINNNCTQLLFTAREELNFQCARCEPGTLA